MLATQADLFTPYTPANYIAPWKPQPISDEEWRERDFRAVFAWKMQTLAKLRANPAALTSAKHYYSTRPAEFIAHWIDTFDPRKAPNAEREELRGPKWQPFVPFEKQYEVITFLHELRTSSENGLIEKCRDAGVTWLSCAYSIWSWLFIPSDAIGWGSRKQELVDKLGDVSSIFEKLRMIIRRLPDIWQPAGLKARDHLTFMKCINPENGATITGETGDNIGRGGRTSMYFKDESAHYERPEKIEAALGDNTNVQVDISSVNGLGNVFWRRRDAGVDWSPGKRIPSGFTRVLVFDWSDHPDKSQQWYDQRKAKAEREGMQHIFAQEVDRNYSAAVQNTIIQYEWLEACRDAHLHVPYLAEHIARQGIPNVWHGGLDVADGGMDRNALVLRQWIIYKHCEEWGERDAGVTARRAVITCRGRAGPHMRVKLQYDNIGVGSTVKAEYNRLRDAGELIASDPELIGWNAGAAVINPAYRSIPDDDESPLNRDMFGNFKAQAWWDLRTRCYKTWRARTQGVIYPVDELVSFDSATLGAEINGLFKELAQPTRASTSGLRTIVDKQPDGTRSPNKGDAAVMAGFPVPDDGGVYVGGYSA